MFPNMLDTILYALGINKHRSIVTKPIKVIQTVRAGSDIMTTPFQSDSTSLPPPFSRYPFLVVSG
jgi:hypothetical protein